VNGKHLSLRTKRLETCFNVLAKR